MSSTGIWASDGLNGPPAGTPSTVTRSASNSFRPQTPMFASRLPLSEPLPVSRPATSCSASATVFAPRRRNSSPEITETGAATSSASSEIFVAETTIVAATAGFAGAWARSEAGSPRTQPARTRAVRENTIRRMLSKLHGVRLGIDFGTTHTVVALVDRGNTPVVSFEGGDFVPSLVALEEATGERRYGWEAFAVRHEPGWTVIRTLKRLLDGAGPETELSIGRWRLPLGALLSGFFSALHRELVEGSNAGLTADEGLTAAVSVPANATTAQRFLTLEAFKAGGFAVEALLNEPSAAGFEYAHRYRRADPKREYLGVYDLGGGAFRASLLRMTGKTNEVVATTGVRRLGGDDFDEAILGLVLDRAFAGTLAGEERAFVLEECVRQKESLSPNTRRVLVDLAAIGKEPLVIPVDEIYAACAPLVERSLEAVEPLLAGPEGGGAILWSDIAGLYVVGGRALFPLVTRVLKERFGEKRVRRSPHPFAATAMALAVFLDREAGWALSDKLPRHFGVFRESDAGTDVVFDAIFPKGTALPGAGAARVTVVRRYRAAHNVGHFRFLECTRLMGGRLAGDVTPWDEVLFPFERPLRERALSTTDVKRRADGPEVVETYTLGSEGAVSVTVTDTSDGFTRTFTLRR